MGFSSMFACETSTEPQSESGLKVLRGPGGEAQEHVVRVSEKQRYTEADPALVTLWLVDPEVDSSSVLVCVMYLDPYQHWTSVLESSKDKVEPDRMFSPTSSPMAGPARRISAPPCSASSRTQPRRPPTKGPAPPRALGEVA